MHPEVRGAGSPAFHPVTSRIALCARRFRRVFEVMTRCWLAPYHPVCGPVLYMIRICMCTECVLHSLCQGPGMKRTNSDQNKSQVKLCIFGIPYEYVSEKSELLSREVVTLFIIYHY
jgi:hypothetical protein